MDAWVHMVAWPLFNGQLSFSESALAVNTMVRHCQHLQKTVHWLFLSVGGSVVPLCLHCGTPHQRIRGGRDIYVNGMQRGGMVGSGTSALQKASPNGSV